MNRRSLIALAAIGLAGVMAVAQDSKPSNPRAPEHVAPTKEPVLSRPDTTGLAVDPTTYVIGAEDVLRILIWRDEYLSGSALVRPDGKISRPLVGDIQAAGLTPERLAEHLKEAYKEKLRNPEISVELIEVNSKRYNIAGAISRTGRFPLIVPTKVFDAIGQAGAFKDFAKKKDILIIREDGTRLHFNYEQFVKGKTKKDLQQNIFLKNGDTVLVQER
jgi:polysaccharide biosynthesis/export protein